MRLNITPAGSGSATTPGGSNTQVQFNDSSAFGGDAGFTYNKTTDTITLGGNIIMSAAQWSIGSGTANSSSIVIGSGTAYNNSFSAKGGTAGTVGGSEYSIAIIGSAAATDAIALGRFSSANFDNAVALGRAAQALAASTFAIGYATTVNNGNGVAIGQSATSSLGGISIGFSSSATGTSSTNIGAGSTASGAYGVSIGNGHTNTGTKGVAIGFLNNVSTTFGIAIGIESVVDQNFSMAFGALANTSATYQAMFGSTDFPLTINNYGGLKINIGGGDYDTQIQGDTDANMIYGDASTDRVGIGTATPATKLDISSTAPSFQMTDTTASAKSLRVVTDANMAAFYEAAGAAGDILSLDLANKRVGIGTNAPTNILSLSGQAAQIAWMERHTTSNTAGNTLTIQAGGATSGATDKAGGNLVLAPGASTGTGRTQVNIKGYTTATATGTSDNTQLDRMIVGAIKTLTNNTGIALANHTIANGSVIAGIIRYAVEVTDGTDYQIEEGCVSFHVTNKAGTLANNTTVKYGNQQAMTSGTLTVTFTITAANPAVLTVNANSSLTPSTGYPRITYSIENLTQQAIAVQ